MTVCCCNDVVNIINTDILGGYQVYTTQGTFSEYSCLRPLLQLRAREYAEFDENRRAVGMLIEPMLMEPYQVHVPDVTFS